MQNSNTKNQGSMQNQSSQATSHQSTSGQNFGQSQSSQQDVSKKSTMGSDVKPEMKNEKVDANKSEQKSDQRPDNKQTDMKAEGGRSQNLPQTQGAQRGQQKDQHGQQKGDLSSMLQGVLPEFNKEDISAYGQKIVAYAEEKPMQTVGWAVAGGALVGWLLISKQGQSVLRTGASIAAPFITNILQQRGEGGGIGQVVSKVADEAQAVVRH